MSKIISVCSEKGGVGKTTTTVNVAGGLVQLGKKVLVIDLDQQQNASRTLGYIKDGKLTVAELIYNAVADIDTNLSDVIRHNESGIDYIPSRLCSPTSQALWQMMRTAITFSGGF